MRAPEYDGGPMKATAEVNRSWFALAIGQISYAPRIVVLRRGGRCSTASHADCKPQPIPRSFFSFVPAMLLCMGWFFLVSLLDLAAKSHELMPLLPGGIWMGMKRSTANQVLLKTDAAAKSAVETPLLGWCI